MPEIKYEPVRYRHNAFVKKATKRKGFSEAYDALEGEYALAREMLAARSRSGLTQEAVATLMGTTKSAVSRLESADTRPPSVASLKKYAAAVGCTLKIEFVPKGAKTNPRSQPDTRTYARKTVRPAT